MSRGTDIQGPGCCPGWYESYPPAVPCGHPSCWAAAAYAGKRRGIEPGWWYWHPEEPGDPA